MKHKRLIHPAALSLLLTIIVAILSWIGGIYGWNGVNNMLCGEGLRYGLHSATSVYVDCPFLGPVLFMSFGIGLFNHSRLWKLCTELFKGIRKPSRKERRAAAFAIIYACLYILLMALLAFGPSHIVRSVTGSLSGSALASGSWLLLAFGIGSMSVVYAYAVDFYKSHFDIVLGMAHGVRIFGSYFVTLFFVCQLFSVVSYTGIVHPLSIPDDWVTYIYYICCLLPLAMKSEK